jgi:hypothetical protein
MNHARAFAAGFLSTLIFHQGVILLFYLLGAIPSGPWSMAPTAPFGVPQVISLSFWAGVWGIALWPLLQRTSGTAFWVRAVVLGAIGPTVVAFLVVAPLKGRAFGMGWDPKLWIGGFIVNGAWGFGLALLIRLLRRVGL